MRKLQRSEPHVGVPASTNRGTDRKTGETVRKPLVGVFGSLVKPGQLKGALALSLALALLGILSPTAAQAATPAVYIWGHGPAKAQEFQYPTAIQGLPSGIVAVQAGNWGGMALDSSGHVWDWGHGQYGELGDGKPGTTRNTAVEAQGPTNVVSIGEGDDFAAAVDKSGNVWVWGDNLDGTLCLSHKRSIYHPVKLQGLDATAVQGGGAHLLILLANGTVDACGVNQYGQLGDGTTKGSAKPVAVSNLTHVVAISAGDLFSSALESDGSVWTWGRNSFGQLGIGSTANQDVPQEVALPAPAKQVYDGGDFSYDGHIVVLLSNNEMMAWGNDQWGQLGNGISNENFTTPQRVDIPSRVTLASVAAGGRDTFAIDSAGNLWVCGYNGTGDLGITNKVGNVVSTPKEGGNGFLRVSATADEAIAVSTGP